MHPALDWRVKDPERMLRIALYFSSRGIPVVPFFRPRATDDGRLKCSCGSGTECTRPAKHPQTAKGILDATTAEAPIRLWWKQDPYANVGLQCGGIEVLDYDSQESSRALLGRFPHLKRASFMVVRTPRGGRHQYFGRDPSLGAGETAHDFVHKIDWQSHGSAVLAPGSQGVTGQFYEPLFPWSYVTRQPFAIQLPQVPTDVMDYIAEQKAEQSRSLVPSVRTPSPVRGSSSRGKQSAESFLDESCRRMTAAVEGNRNDTLARLALTNFYRMTREKDIHTERITLRLIEAAMTTGMPEAEASRTINKALVRSSRDDGRRAAADASYRRPSVESAPEISQQGPS